MDKIENKKGLKLINQISFYLKKLAQVYIKIKGNKAKREKSIKKKNYFINFLSFSNVLGARGNKFFNQSLIFKIIAFAAR